MDDEQMKRMNGEEDVNEDMATEVTETTEIEATDEGAVKTETTEVTTEKADGTEETAGVVQTTELKPGNETMGTGGMVEKTEKSKTPMVAAIAGGVIVVAAVLGIAGFMMTRPDYKAAYEKVTEVNESLEKFADDSGCAELMDGFSESSVSNEKIEGYVKTCQDDVKKMTDEIDKLGKMSGVKHDKEVKASFEKVEQAWKKLTSKDTGLEKDLGSFVALHEFIVLAEEADMAEDPEAMLDLGKIMINSGNEKFKQFGESWNERAQKVIDLMNELKSATSTSERLSLQQDLIEAAEGFQDLADDMDGLESSINFNADNAEEFDKAFEAMADKIKEKM